MSTTESQWRVRSALLTCAPLLALVLLHGCQASRRPAPADDYQTVAPEPARDADAAERHNTRGLELLSEGDLAGAGRAFRAALAADVMHGPAHNNLGKVYFRQRKLYLAAWEFHYASKLMPHQPEPLNNLGLVFEASRDFDDAVESYGKAMGLEPNNPQVIGNLARARLRRGDRDAEVRDLLSKLVTLDTRPDWLAWARRELALMLGDGGASMSAAADGDGADQRDAIEGAEGVTGGNTGASNHINPR